jgi:hypothetical protein
MSDNTFYFFEYDRPGKKPGRTSWRMTIAEAALRHPGYRPILETAEVRADNKWDSFVAHAPGTGPLHWVNGSEKVAK